MYITVISDCKYKTTFFLLCKKMKDKKVCKHFLVIQKKREQGVDVYNMFPVLS